tara:strand:+ start:125 stop:388 length:264 start_codon:yes stop_codon:yes gene_type:complete
MAYNNQPDWEKYILNHEDVWYKKEEKIEYNRKEWLIEQFKDCEEGKLTKDQRIKFLDFLDEYKETKYLYDAFKEFQNNKKNNIKTNK